MGSKLLTLLYMIGVAVLGTSIITFMKLTDMTSSDSGKFNHLVFQTALPFYTNCSLLLVAWYLSVRPQSSVEPTSPLIPKEQPTNNYSYWVLIYPACCDLIGSAMNLIGLYLSAPSIYQMVKGFLVIPVAVFSLLFLKKELSRHQWIGIGIVILGIGIVSISALLYQSISAINPLLGIPIRLIAQLFIGAQLVLEEKILQMMQITALKVVGAQGVVGSVIFLVLLPLLNFIPCPSSDPCGRTSRKHYSGIHADKR